jgi:hypothetical protein
MNDHTRCFWGSECPGAAHRRTKLDTGCASTLAARGGSGIGLSQLDCSWQQSTCGSWTMPDLQGGEEDTVPYAVAAAMLEKRWRFAEVALVCQFQQQCTAGHLPAALHRRPTVCQCFVNQTNAAVRCSTHANEARHNSARRPLGPGWPTTSPFLLMMMTRC